MRLQSESQAIPCRLYVISRLHPIAGDLENLTHEPGLHPGVLVSIGDMLLADQRLGM